jgi:hypothetical protein
MNQNVGKINKNLSKKGQTKSPNAKALEKKALKAAGAAGPAGVDPLAGKKTSASTYIKPVSLKAKSKPVAKPKLELRKEPASVNIEKLTLFHTRNLSVMCRPGFKTTGDDVRDRLYRELSLHAKSIDITQRLKIEVKGTEEDIQLAEHWWKSVMRDVLLERENQAKAKRALGASVSLTSLIFNRPELERKLI